MPPSALRISPPFSEWETYYFQLGLWENLFTLDEQGEVRSELFRGTAENEEISYPLFSSGPPARLLRENVCQLAVASCLIYQRGWLPRHLSIEHGRPEHHAALPGFELLVKSLEGNVLIWVETKRSRVELEKLISDLRTCSRRGPHGRDDCGFPQNHPRWEFALWARPQYLWAVAPDGELPFAVHYDGSATILEPLPALPHRSRLESP